MEKKEIRSRGWCFTVNNYTENDVLVFKELDTQYIVFGFETAPTTGTPHLQGYVYFKDNKTMSAVTKYLKKNGIQTHVNLYSQKGTFEEASGYCKYNDYPINTILNEFYEKGDPPNNQGKRTDLEKIKEVVKTTGKMSEVVQVATSYQSVKMAEQILKYHEIKRTWKPFVYWFWGPTGTGKSKTAFEMFPDAYPAMSTARWWDGYDAHESVIIDDMRKDFCKFHELLRYLDRYSVTVETKGGTRQFLAKNIIITSCYHPQELFETREDINQLIRRIDEIRKFV